MTVVPRNLKLTPLFSLLFCAFVLLVSPTRALADTIDFCSTMWFLQGDSVEADASAHLFYGSVGFDTGSGTFTYTGVGTSSGALGQEQSSSSSSSYSTVNLSTVPPQWSIQNNVDYAGSLRPIDSSSVGPGYWWSAAYVSASELGVASATRNETTSGSVSTSGTVSTTTGTRDVSLSSSETGSGSTASSVFSQNRSGYLSSVPLSVQSGQYIGFMSYYATQPAIPSGSVLYVMPGRYMMGLDPSNAANISFLDTSSWRVFGLTSDGNGYEITADPDTGLYVTDRPFVGFRFITQVVGSCQNCYVFLPEFTFSIQVPDGATIDAIGKQTDTLMSTDGSDSIVSGATSGGEDGLLDKLGFIGTVVHVPLSILDGLTSSEESTITFPGISVPLPGGNFVIPATEIDIWENFPALETPVRTGCTFVCVLLWLNGCKSLYDRIVHGDQDVIIEEGSA